MSRPPTPHATQVRADTDDALGDLDGTGVAAAVARGALTCSEVVDAAIRRVEAVDAHLGAVAATTYADAYREAAGRDADAEAVGPARPSRSRPFAGVPTVVKDNVDLLGQPTQYGSAAFTAAPARSSEPVVRQLLATGPVVIARTTLPEFGFNASTESRTTTTRNPWHTDHTAGGSSGGSAALVAAGAVPFAHGNDGGGSLRIPAACCGLVGMKTTRGREAAGRAARGLPVDIVGNGVMTRTVRDLAAWVAALDGRQRDHHLPDVGLVTTAGPRCRVGVVLDAPGADPTDAPTRAAVEDVAALLEELGHAVLPVAAPVGADVGEAFLTYWASLAWTMQHGGRVLVGGGFDPRTTDPLTQELARELRRRALGLPGAIATLRRSPEAYARAFDDVDGVDVVLSPTVAHTTPRLGHLGPDQPGEQTLERLRQWAAFTPANNAAGGPGISLPLGATEQGLPIGVHLSAAHGDDRALLEMAVELEEARPFRRVGDPATPPGRAEELHRA